MSKPRNIAGYLIIEDHPNLPGKLPYFEGQNIIGRNPAKADVPIQEISISEKHAKLVSTKEQISITDLGSKNGIYINNLDNRLEKGREIVITQSMTFFISEIKCRVQRASEKETKEDTLPISKTKIQNKKETKKDVLKMLFDDDDNKSHNDSKKVNEKEKEPEKLKGKAKDKEKDNLKGKNTKTQVENETFKPKIQEQEKVKDEFDLDEIISQKQKDQNDEKLKKNLQKKNGKGNDKSNLDKKKQSKNEKKKQSLEKSEITQKDKTKLNSETSISNPKVNAKENLKKGGQTSEPPNIKSAKDKSTDILKGKNQAVETKKDKDKQTRVSADSKKTTKAEKKPIIEEKVEKVKKEVSKDQESENQTVIEEEEPCHNTKQKNRKSKPKEENRKKLPKDNSIEVNRNSPYPRRTFQTKKVLVSGFPLSFKPCHIIEIVEDIDKEYDVLVMQKFTRTFKVLYTIAKGIPIVSFSWLIQSQFSKRIQSFEKHYFAGGIQFIYESIKKVQQGFKVFKNYSFYLLSKENDYHLKITQIEDLIYACGGEVIKQIPKNKSRSSDIIGITKLQFDKSDLENAKKHGIDKVYTIEMILSSCLNQNLDLEDNVAA